MTTEEAIEIIAQALIDEEDELAADRSE